MRSLIFVVSLIEDILLTLKWQQQGSITLFLNSLLEKLSETTMYLTPSIRLPQNVVSMILLLLQYLIENLFM